MSDEIKEPTEGNTGLGEQPKLESGATEPNPETGSGPAGPASSTTGGEETPPKPQEPKPEPPKREDDDEKVTLSKGELRGLLTEVEEKVEGKFEKKLADVDEELGILREASDEKRLFNVERAKKGPIQHTLDLFVYENRVVVGWKINKDEVFKNPSGIWVERQSIEIVLEPDAEGKERKVEFENYLRFDDIKRANLKNVKILGKETLEDGNGTIVYRVEHPVKKGEEIKISAPFVN